jgi:hypothetical protein
LLAFRRKLAGRKKKKKKWTVQTLDRFHPCSQTIGPLVHSYLPTTQDGRKWDKIHSSILLSVAWKAARSWECTFEDEEEADGTEEVDNEEEDVDADDEDEDVYEEDENVDEENEDVDDEVDEVDEEVHDEHLDVADDDDGEERWDNLLRQESKGSLLEEEAASEEE